MPEPELIRDLPALEIISCYGVGVDAIDLQAAKERGIVVTTTPDVLTEDVADMALSFVLASVREILIGDRFVRSGKWQEAEKPVSQCVGGKRLGILGFGPRRPRRCPPRRSLWVKYCLLRPGPRCRRRLSVFRGRRNTGQGVGSARHYMRSNAGKPRGWSTAPLSKRSARRER